MLPRTSLYCTTVSQNSIIPVPNFYAPVTFFPLHLIVVVFIVTYPRLWLAGNLSLTSSSAPLVFVGVKRRFLWTLFRNFSFNNIPSMFCLFRCWSFVYKTLECLQRNFILSFSQCSVWIGVIKRLISIPVHLWNIKTTHIGKHSETWCINITYAL